MSITFEWDSRQLRAFGQTGKAVQKALSKSGSDAIRLMKSGSSRLVRQRKRIKVKRVSDGLPLFFPKGKQDLVWIMRVSGEPIPVSSFPVRQTKRGVSVAINTGKRTLIKSAFIATMRSGHRGVFLRALSGVHGPVTKKQAKRGHVFRVGRLPIEEAFTTRISDVFNDSGFIPFVQAGGQASFTKSFERLLPIEIDRLTRR